ncbi:MAG TPA: hypothetical protein VHA52_04190 [Candidatus Babeliaceae bacterium]|nr:hypothetical protein [Candidatus Babeliaceae bacterium]
MNCDSPFVVTNWDKYKKYCGTKCASEARFGDPQKRRLKTKAKLLKILEDQKYIKYLTTIARKIGIKYEIEAEEIMQDFFLALCIGHNASIEQTSMETLRKEYNRGVVGKRLSAGVISSADYDELCKFKTEESCDIKRLEYLHDIKSRLSEDEWKICALSLFGFNAAEIINAGIPRRKVYSFNKKYEG